MAEWAVYWQSAGVIATTIFGIVGLLKIYQELKRLNEQREKDISDKETAAKLKRTEFFLAQHRRLFDDKDLYSVLCLIDADSPKLAEEEMWDQKRKLLAFLEEIALLVSSNQINKDVALYMFGYYAICAQEGKNFRVGIDLSRKYWELLYRFVDDAKIYLKNNENGPPANMTL
ncbi:hypothetical protein H8K32_19190 [Undibacterium jejuense]|uniref:DUF4760 domain-containing protein n=2 Tax=Undibacterium jejuense TaxID=1344949 RepID=A0A923HT41_9BURK|nr:hypothetical protein [Undibacterium jejuense]